MLARSAISCYFIVLFLFFYSHFMINLKKRKVAFALPLLSLFFVSIAVAYAADKQTAEWHVGEIKLAPFLNGTRIRTLGFVKADITEEKLFFDLDNVSETRYYLSIGKENADKQGIYCWLWFDGQWYCSSMCPGRAPGHLA